MSIGLPLKRVDAEAKVTGSARYTDDNIMLGMRHAKYVRSSIAHGKVTAIDASEALALHGVEAVFTHEDVPTACFRTAGHAWSLDETKRDVKDRRLLTDHVRHFGDGVGGFCDLRVGGHHFGNLHGDCVGSISGIVLLELRI